MEDTIRLLICQKCKSLEELPGAESDPGNVLLDRLVAMHPHGDAPVGNLVSIPKKLWDQEGYRTDIMKQVRDALRGEASGLPPDFYVLKDTYTEDALTCFKKHQRNPACPDYKSDSKVLNPGTAQLRKEEGLPKFAGPKRYLCEFCPVHSLVQQAQRATKLGA